MPLFSTILMPLLIAFLGAYAGKEGTSLAWRRWGIPAVLIAYAWPTYEAKALILLLLIPILSIGYGEDALLRKWAEKVTAYPNALTRSIIAGLAAVVIMSIVGPGMKEFFWTLFLTIIWYNFGGDDIIKNEGTIGGLLVEDLILYSALGLYASVLLS